MKKYYLFFTLITALFFSFEKEPTLLEEPASSESTITYEGIEVGSENGYLVLNSFEDAIQLASVLENTSDDEILRFNKLNKYTSAYSYRKKLSKNATSLSDEAMINSITSELKSNGYFDSESNSLVYPFYVKPWAKILNNNGIIKINETLMRFWNENQICSETNDLQRLIQIQTIEELQNENFKVFDTRGKFLIEDKNSILKSIDIPSTSCQLWPSDYFDVINNVGGTDYRRRTNLVSLIYWDSNQEITGHLIYISHNLSKKILRIWWIIMTICNINYMI